MIPNSKSHYLYTHPNLSHTQTKTKTHNIKHTFGNKCLTISYRNSFLKYNLTFQGIGHPCSFSWANADQTPPVHLTLRFFIVIDAECNIFLFSFHWHIA